VHDDMLLSESLPDDADEAVKYDTGWSSTTQAEVSRGPDRWTVELAIPRSDMGIPVEQGSTTRILLCRNIVHTRPKGEHDQLDRNEWPFAGIAALAATRRPHESPGIRTIDRWK
jgi:hypothetical protein